MEPREAEDWVGKVLVVDHDITKRNKYTPKNAS